MNRLLIFILFLLLLPIIQIKPININEFYDNYITIQVTGEVEKEGLFKVNYGSSINDLVEEGIIKLTQDADLSTINLNYTLSDSDVINFTKVKEIEEIPLISINNSSIEELCQLDGIGITTANKIIEFRNKNGHFEKLEDIMLVNGIKEAKFKLIKDYICL